MKQVNLRNWQGWSLALVAFMMSGWAWADHPQPGQMAEVKNLAHQLQLDSVEAHHQAEHHAGHHDQMEQEAIRALHRLQQRAEHFHHEVEEYFSNPAHTETDYQQLNEAYFLARVSFYYLSAYEEVEYLFERMITTMNRLRVFYGYRGRVWNGHEVQESAHRIQTSARHTYDRARAEAHHGGFWKKWAVRALRTLKRQARHFHHQVEHNNSGSSHSRQDLRDLWTAYRTARRDLRRAHFSAHVLVDFNRMGQYLAELEEYYYVVPGNSDHPHEPGHDDDEPADGDDF